MRCKACQRVISLPTFKEIRVDTLYKEYTCDNGHLNIVLRYGNCIEVNGKIRYVSEWFMP